MRSIAAIGVDDDLAPGQSRVALRAASHKASGGINMILGLIVEQVAGHRVSDNVFANLRSKLFVRHFGSVLRRDYHRVDPERTAISVFNCNLGLTIRAKVGKLARLSCLRKS